MTNDNLPSDHEQHKQRLRVTHFGMSKLGAECAVLEDGRRGYVQTSLQQAIGLKTKNPGRRFAAFLAEIAPNALMFMGKSGYPIDVTMPHGGVAKWVESGILTEIASGVIDAALDGRLGKIRAHLVKPCRDILKALGKTGEAALIDEATGYQYHRAPDALQDLFAKIIRDSASDWERRFPPDYYTALCKVYRIPYSGAHRALPSIIGDATLRWVYQVVFPAEIISEIKARRSSEKLHQWLTMGGGLPLLERQVAAVTLIAKSAVDRHDFEARCSVSFYRQGLQTKLVFPVTPANDSRQPVANDDSQADRITG